MTDLEQNPYSPQCRNTVYGQSQAESLFLQAWNSNRPHHAWLLTGDKGIGKASFAYQIAKFVLHQGTDQNNSMDSMFANDDNMTGLSVPIDCQTVHLVNSGAHPDFRVLSHEFNATEKATTIIDVEQARTVAHLIHQKPSMGQWRVLIVDAVDDLNNNSANAILKMLEEPPANTIFLLVCHSLGKILPTIRSRCRTLALSPLSDDDVTTIISEQMPNADNGHVNASIKMANGSAGKALDLLENDSLEILNDFVGILGDFPNMNMVKIQALGNTISGVKNRKKLNTMRDISEMWSYKFIRTMAINGDFPEILQGEGQLYQKLSMLSPVSKWQHAWDTFHSKINLIDAPSYLDPKQVLVDAFTSLHHNIKVTI